MFKKLLLSSFVAIATISPLSSFASDNKIPPISKTTPASLYSSLKAESDLGDENAMINLGYRLSDGQGFLDNDKSVLLPIDNKQALQWFEKAANQGNVTAMYNLAIAHLRGMYKEKPYKARERAVYWLQLASDRRFAPAIDKLKSLPSVKVTPKHIRRHIKYRNNI